MTSEVDNILPYQFLNINIGLLGHVDSGKTSLSKCLSEISSTACFDKHPQSRERGITIDLGFSSFSSPPSNKFKEKGYQKIQYTLVDCPGHASLIRTIIGGVHIIDVVILVIDVTKGIQTQTAECLVISQIANKSLMIALNKIDLVEQKKRDDTIKKVTKKLEQTLSNTLFKNTPIVPVIAKEGYSGDRGLTTLIETLNEIVAVPERQVNKPLVLAVDHCFLIKGKGTVLTGTVLQGSVKLNDVIEIPALKETKKVKTIQMFRRDVPAAIQGDRIGICVKQFDPSQIERALVCSPGYVPLLYGAIILLNKVVYFKGDISSNTKYHISIGYETLIGKVTLFSSDNDSPFDLEKDFPYQDKFNDELPNQYYGLIEFEKPIYAPPDSIIIGSKLDVNLSSNNCRLAFFGNIIHNIQEKDYINVLLPNLKLYVIKEKIGLVQNVLNENELVCHRLFKKSSSVQKFLNLKVILSTGESGYIESSFGQKDKVRIRIPNGLQSSAIELLSYNKKQGKGKFKNENVSHLNSEKKETVKVILRFKRYIYNKDKNISQSGMF